MTVELTKRFLRIRVKPPGRYKKIRTDDIGRKGHSLRRAGLNPKTGRWETQSWLINRKDLEKRDIRAWTLLNKVAGDLPKRTRAEILMKIRKLT